MIFRFKGWLKLAVIALLLAASACGQKGDLYRPNSKQQSVVLTIKAAV